MSLFGSLYSSTTGLLASSRSTDIISQNVANLNTVGYKRSSVAFRDLVFSSKGSARDTLAGVSTTRLLQANQAGSIFQTSSSTDASISGEGMFAVKRTIDPADDNFYFTRNGQFGEFAIRNTSDSGAFTTENTNEETYLMNSAGFFLYGWPLDQDGNITGGTTLDSLQPINVGIFESQPIPTTEVNFGVNLNASESDYDGHAFTVPQQLPMSNQAAHFSRNLTVYDSAGTQRAVTAQFRKVLGPMAHFTSNTSPLDREDVLVDNAGGPTPGITNGDIFQISDGTNTLNITFVNGVADTSLNQANTVDDVLRVINNFTAGAPATQQFEARISESGRLLVQAKDPTVTLNISGSDAPVLGATGLNFVTDPSDGDYIYDPDYDITNPGSAPYTAQGDFPAFADTTTPNTQGWWEMTLLIPDPANPSGGTLTTLRQGLINFDGSGALNALPGADGEISIDLSTTPINFDNAGTDDDTSLTLNITNFSQFSGNYNVLLSQQNGAGIGTRNNIEIQRDGTVTAVFSNGIRSDIYKIPLATFANVNGLREVNDTAYVLTDNSGDVVLLEAGTGGAGILNPATLENSNVDLAEEFGYLIVSQRSFSLNSQVINAVNEMTQVLRDLT